MRGAITAAVVSLLAVSPAGLAAQGDCFPSADSHEAQLFAHFSAPLAFSAAQSPWAYRPGSVQVGLEGTYLPDASDRIATPTVCRPGKGPEDVNLLAAFPRPRLAYSLAHGVLLEISWVPPVTINHVRPNLWGFALSRSVPLSPHMVFMGRVHATIGSLKAPFVCSERAIADPTSECSTAKAPSKDTYKPNIFGVELAMAFPQAQGRFRPYLGAGYNILHPRFQVYWVNTSNVVDNRKVEVNLSRLALFGGVTLAPAERFNLSFEGYSTPSDLVTARVRANLVFGGLRR
jgi:hypothetical protein